MHVIGQKCVCIRTDSPLYGRHLRITGVARGSARVRKPYMETDDAEFVDEPVLPDERVRVEAAGHVEPLFVRAADLDIFRHLAPRMVKLDVQLEEATTQELLFAARHLGRPIDMLINDAVAALVRQLGVDRTKWTTLIGLPTVG